MKADVRSIGCALFIASTAAGETVTLPVPELAGSYAAGAERVVAIDVGQQFDSIDEVRIQWSGGIAAGLAQGDGLCSPPVFLEWPGQMCAYFDVPEGGFWNAYSGENGPFEEQVTFDDFFTDSWDFLLDGQAEMTVELSPYILICAGGIILPTGSIDEATLIIDGTLADSCPADLDSSGDVGFADLLQVLEAWGPCEEICPEDLNGNGAVDFADVLLVIVAWGACS